MDRFNILKKSISSIVTLTDEEFLVLCESFTLRKLAKNELFLEEGTICDYIGFVNSGVLIYFQRTANCDEITIDFSFEEDWVTVNQSRLTNSKSLISIKAIETCELLVISQKNLSELYIRIPKLERLGRILMEQSFLKIAQQSIDLQLLSATDRYKRLLSHYPTILQRVQLYHIANYLGIAPKSLSRIRKQLFD
jgi:CRP/FNR family transcriptional regulator, anaerobic regulatory protein